MELPSIFKGSCTEMQCALAFIEKGYEVSFPFGNHARYDFIVDIKGKLVRIQVKTAKEYDTYIEFECRSSRFKSGHYIHKTYSSEEVDYFSTFYKGQCYLVPSEECSATKRLRFQPTSNSQTKGVNMAENYVLEEFLKNF